MNELILERSLSISLFLDRTSDIFEEVYFSATERYEDNYLERLTSAPRIETRTCEREKKQIVKEYAEIRPLVRLFRRSSPDRRETKPSEPSFNWRQYVSTETRRPSIKFSTSTALYTPPKPSYDNIRSSGSPNPRETHPRERAGVFFLICFVFYSCSHILRWESKSKDRVRRQIFHE